MNTDNEKRDRTHHEHASQQEREWLAQERALRSERLHATETGDPLVARYRLVMRALRQPRPDGLPADFAAQMARRVNARAPLDLGVEQLLLRALTAVLTLSASAAAWWYGPSAWQAIAAVWPQSSASAATWAVALAVCVGGSWILDRWRQRGTPARPAGA
jgi:hypothetical protein